MATVHIPDVSCSHCKATVEKAIKIIDPEAHINFDIEARRVALDSVMEAVKVQAALSDAGYPATPV